MLVTGCAGFIGSHLCEHYLRNNANVFGLDNFSTGTKENIKILLKYPNFQFQEFDITKDWSDIKLQLTETSHVFHLASPAAVNHYQALSIETMWANSIGLGNALAFATNKNARLVFASTSEIYGSPAVTPQSESYWGNVNSVGDRSCYDESKRFGEALIYSWNKKYASKHGLVRIFNTYGPRMNLTDGRVILNFVRQAQAGKELTIYGDGEQSRSFCYIDDLIRGLDLYAKSELTVPVNLGNDEEIKVKDVARIVIEITQSKSQTRRLSLPSDDPPQRKPDLTLAREALGYSPEILLIEGLKRLTSQG